MLESTTYQAIIREGFERGFKEGFEEGFEEACKESIKIRRILMAQSLMLARATEKFGNPSPVTLAMLGAIEDLPTLERMASKVTHFSSWGELLAEAAAS